MTDWMLIGLADLFAETVTIEPYVSQDGYGEETFGAAVTRNCHIQGRNRLVRDPTGEERTSTLQVFLDGAYNTSVKDRVTLPARFSPQTPPMIARMSHSDENGSHSEVLFF